eukprot:TRINITY_DN760_c0_g2_i1.p1 TRINITY_DN760_c0_g2~~TRINITY_DN760_c0_g2_i1.p1  ORF type:complete len:341 (-),score=58.67 TRINITY_DN760_c0_g2_i1:100-1056(-)
MATVTCNHCNGIIGAGASFLNALGKTYHQEHFVCRSCSNPLGTSQFFNVNGQAYCSNCYHTHDVPNCSHCTRPLLRGQDFLKYEGLSYHTICFTCAQCGKELKTNDFFKQDGKKYCGGCVDKISSTSNYVPTPQPTSSSSSYVPHYPPKHSGSSSSTYTALPASSSSSYNPSSSSSSYDSSSTYPPVVVSKSSSNYSSEPVYQSAVIDPPVVVSKSSSTYSSEPVYQSAVIEEPFQVNYSSGPDDDYGFSAEINVDITPPTRNTYNFEPAGGADEISLDSILSDLENSGSDFNKTYSTYGRNDEDDLQDILRDLETPL